jgi:hypothetical protein
VKSLQEMFTGALDQLSLVPKFSKTLVAFVNLLDFNIVHGGPEVCSSAVSATLTYKQHTEYMVTSVMYDLFPDNTFCGRLKLDPEDKAKKKGDRSKGEEKKDDETKLKYVEISDTSLATLLASDMLKSARGRQQVFALLQKAQTVDYSDPKSLKLDWWNNNTPVKIGRSVNVMQLVSFLSNDFVRSSFNFAVKLCNSSETAGSTSKIENVHWTNIDTWSSAQMLQYFAAHTEQRSEDFLTAAKQIAAAVSDRREGSANAIDAVSLEYSALSKDPALNKFPNIIKKLKAIQGTVCSRDDGYACASSVCKFCDCICCISVRFQAPIWNLLKECDHEFQIRRHLSFSLDTALKERPKVDCEQLF